MGIAKANKNTLRSIGEGVCSMIVFYFLIEINPYLREQFMYAKSVDFPVWALMYPLTLQWGILFPLLIYFITYLLRSHVNQKTNDSSQYYEYQQNCYHHHNS